MYAIKFDVLVAADPNSEVVKTMVYFLINLAALGVYGE
jgi:hypothetical protein